MVKPTRTISKPRKRTSPSKAAHKRSVRTALLDRVVAVERKLEALETRERLRDRSEADVPPELWGAASEARLALEPIPMAQQVAALATRAMASVDFSAPKKKPRYRLWRDPIAVMLILGAGAGLAMFLYQTWLVPILPLHFPTF